MRTAGLLALLLVATGCGEATHSSAPADAPEEYVVQGLVLESAQHGPQLCFAVRASMPPQCEGTDIAGWSWSEARGEESERGTTWGDYAIHVTYDDGELTMTRPPTEPETIGGDEDSDLTSPCPEPDDGWFPPARVMMGDADLTRAMHVARRDPSFTEVWVDQRPVGEPSEETMNDPTRLILNVRVTEDTAGMERRIREVWGGALCVSLARHTDADLERIDREVTRTPGVHVIGSSWGDDRVDLEVFLDEGGELQQRLDATYGEGVVRVHSALQPAEDD